MVWEVIAGALASAGAGIFGANKASNAVRDAANQQADIARQNMLFQAQLNEPTRYLGYQAQNDLAALYGYGMQPYQTAQALQASSAGGGGPLNVDGKGGKNPIYGGMVNPATGEVIVYTPGTADRDAALSEAATNYLRTGQGNIGGYGYERIRSAIDQLRGSGWQYQAPTQPGGAGTTPQPGQAGNFGRFFTSPDYQFRLSEGQRNLGNSFAARGGAFSGNALKALNEYNSNLAAGEFGNYFERLSRMAGMGGAATNNTAQAATGTTNALMGAAGAAGDARASGILGSVNSVTNAINTGLNNWLLTRPRNGYGTGSFTDYSGSGYGPGPWAPPGG